MPAPGGPGLGTCKAGATGGVSTAEAALNVLQEWHPDLLISDIGMPIEDGFTLIRKVRSLAPEQGGRVPALALTAYARVEDRLKVLSAGFQMHVAKPIGSAQFAAAVAMLARNGSAAAEELQNPPTAP